MLPSFTPGMDKIIYLDNAATTALSPEVLEAMLPYLQEQFGNPSSAYSLGRKTRSAIEAARRTVASLLDVKPNTIYFTSGGTESNNTAIASAVRDLGCTHIITSPIEHHAVLHTVAHYSNTENVPYSLVKLTPNGEVDYNDLEAALREQTDQGNKCLVSLMHANNETGALLEMERVGRICRHYGAVFHSDCVQSIGHYPINLAESGVHFASAASHKFHGPKGAGLLYIVEGVAASPLLLGGAQERNMRAGTENVYGIVGFAKALELSMKNFAQDSIHIISLKEQLKTGLSQAIPEVTFHSPEHSLYTVLSVGFPDKYMLTTFFDMAGVCVSGGSACSSRDSSPSHVMAALNRTNYTTVRFSFSKYNTCAEIDKTIDVVKSLFHVV